ncbi:MAG TPA: pantetheine-phosphate adenylyltransferase [Candidatus Hydrogenedentes bacterium]|nr:pantetheine-phosphate adenylyltransferase [Candidatus Hydrogenedentota bacterium]HIJ72790.1 pantetheine-phosphate adenylyltransferase [Candidatus Hydrogenedentota bacterium]
MPDRTAIYPGSFDPPTNGHLDLIGRAARIFDRLVVAVATNESKDCLFTVEERKTILEAIAKDIPGVTVTSFDGLSAEFAEEHGAVALVRGLRAISDFEFELSMAVMNKRINPEIETVCLMPSEPYMFLSSRVVKEVAFYGGDISGFVPHEVELALRKKLGT